MIRSDEPVEPVKRGRGRPRKNGSLKSICNIHVHSQAVKPRGRPKTTIDDYVIMHWYHMSLIKRPNLI